jgi:hypothetical protein
MSDQKNVLRLPSSFTSLSKVIISIRDQALVDSTASLSTADRQQHFIPYTYIQELNLYSNNIALWAEPITREKVETELWNQANTALDIRRRDVDLSTTGQLTGSIPIAIDLQSCPQKFQDTVLSGIKTKSHVSDLYAVLQYIPAVVATSLAATCFLCCDVKVGVAQDGSLQIEF